MDIQTPGVYTTGDGSHSVISEQFNESYHSRHGALKESLHVFIEAGLKATKPGISLEILEVGLGTGLNAWLTMIESENSSRKIHYTGIEPYPISLEMAKTLNYPNVAIEEDQEKHKSCFHRIHESDWDSPVAFSDHFTLSKIKSKLEDFNPEQQFDICYFDAFAPNAQPELWTDEIFTKVYDLMKPNGIMVTYCAKGSVKRSLKAIGWKVETLPGPPGKREMIRAIKE